MLLRRVVWYTVRPMVSAITSKALFEFGSLRVYRRPDLCVLGLQSQSSQCSRSLEHADPHRPPWQAPCCSRQSIQGGGGHDRAHHQHLRPSNYPKFVLIWANRAQTMAATRVVTPISDPCCGLYAFRCWLRNQQHRGSCGGGVVRRHSGVAGEKIRLQVPPTARTGWRRRYSVPCQRTRVPPSPRHIRLRRRR